MHLLPLVFPPLRKVIHPLLGHVRSASVILIPVLLIINTIAFMMGGYLVTALVRHNQRLRATFPRRFLVLLVGIFRFWLSVRELVVCNINRNRVLGMSLCSPRPVLVYWVSG